MGTQPAPLGLWFPQEGCLGQGVCAAGSQGGHPRCALAPGPSVALDTACSSSLVALQNAYQAIRHGECPCAIVGGINILLKPNTSVQFLKLGMLSPEGSCKSFDESGEPAEGRGGGQGVAPELLAPGARISRAPGPEVTPARRERLLPLGGRGGHAADQEVPGPARVRHHPERRHQHRWLQGARWVPAGAGGARAGLLRAVIGWAEAWLLPQV